MVRFVKPRTVAEASQLGRDLGWSGKYVGGGTAVTLMLQQGLIQPDVLIGLGDLTDLDGYRAIRVSEATVRIGGAVTLAEVASSPEVNDLVPALASACSQVGNIRVRNVATLAGNLAEADYASDPPAVLWTSDAHVLVVSDHSQRRVRVREFITDFYTNTLEPGEIVSAIEVPGLPADAHGAYIRFSSRGSEDRPAAGVAATLRMRNGSVDDLRIAVGAVRATPAVVDEATSAAIGRPLTEDLINELAAAHAEAIEPMDDSRGSAWYRKQIIKALVRRAVSDVGQQAAAQR